MRIPRNSIGNYYGLYKHPESLMARDKTKKEPCLGFDSGVLLTRRSSWMAIRSWDDGSWGSSTGMDAGGLGFRVRV